MNVEDAEPIELTGFWKALSQLFASLSVRKETESCQVKECRA